MQNHILFGRTLIVVAHPDDEAIGCGLLLQRLKQPVIAFLTDGAPTDRYFWGKFGSRTAYGDLRSAETREALSGLDHAKVESFGARDQELMFQLDAALGWLHQQVVTHQPETIITHAYEGGHPDHDCASFLCAMVGQEFNVPVWEMPLYRRVNGELVRQHPVQGTATEALSIDASEKEVERKSQMIAAYASQLDFLKSFATGSEKFYPQPRHDFSRPPHRGQLNYECWGWEVTGGDLCAAFARLLAKDQLQRAKSA